GLARHGLSGRRAGPARGGSGPGAGACPVPRPGPAGSGLRPAPHRGSGVGLDDAKLVQRERLIGTMFVLPSQVERLVRVLPGLFTVSPQTTALAELHPVDSTTRTYTDTFADRLLQQRAPFREAPLERRGIAQARDDQWQHVSVAGGTREGQALVAHPDGVLQVPLVKVQSAEERV